MAFLFAPVVNDSVRGSVCGCAYPESHPGWFAFSLALGSQGLSGAQLQQNVLVARVQSGKLTLDEYLTSLKAAIERDKKLAIALSKLAKHAQAAGAGAKTASAAGAGAGGDGDDADDDEHASAERRMADAKKVLSRVKIMTEELANAEKNRAQLEADDEE